MLTAALILASKVGNDLRKQIRNCTDLAVLQEAKALEVAAPTPRKSLVDMLGLRIAILEAAQPVASPAPPPAPLLVVEVETLPVVVDVVLPVFVVEDVPPVSTLETPVLPLVVESSPENDCATTFMRALANGDAAMLALLVGVVQTREYKAEALADALLGAYKAQAGTSSPGAAPARAPRALKAAAPQRAPGEGRQPDPVTEKNLARARAATSGNLGTVAEDGTITFNAADLLAAGYHKSATEHQTLWARKGHIRVAIQAIGWDANYKTTPNGCVVVFRRLPPVEVEVSPAA